MSIKAINAKFAPSVARIADLIETRIALHQKVTETACEVSKESVERVSEQIERMRKNGTGLVSGEDIYKSALSLIVERRADRVRTMKERRALREKREQERAEALATIAA